MRNRCPSVLPILLVVVAGPLAACKKPAEPRPLSVSVAVQSGAAEQFRREGYKFQGATVIDLMKSLQKSGQLAYEAEEHAGQGAFITSIGGVAHGGGAFWQMCINGQRADRGVSQLEMQNGDSLLWILSSQQNPCEK